MERLIDIGFRKVGHWSVHNDSLRFSLRPYNITNTIYCFVIAEEVLYVGVANGELLATMRLFLNPPDELQQVAAHIFLNNIDGSYTDIFALKEKVDINLGCFNLNLPAALIDSICDCYNPPWNTLIPEIFEQPVRSFEIPLLATYFKHGCIFIPRIYSHLFGKNLSELDVGFEDLDYTGFVHRTKATHHLRILVGRDLASWLSDSFVKGELLTVTVVNRRLIVLENLNRVDKNLPIEVDNSPIEF